MLILARAALEVIKGSPCSLGAPDQGDRVDISGSKGQHGV